MRVEGNEERCEATASVRQRLPRCTASMTMATTTFRSTTSPRDTRDEAENGATRVGKQVAIVMNWRK